MKDQPTWDIEWWNRSQRLFPSLPDHDRHDDDADESLESDVSLARALSLHYGVSVRVYQQLRSAKGVVAEDGSRYVWKPLKHREFVAKLAQIEWLADRLEDSGVLAAGPIATKEHRLFCQVDEARIGYLQPWLPGYHLNLGQRQERLAAISTVSRMHLTTTVPSGPVVLSDATGPSWRSRPSLLFRRMFHKRQLLLRVSPQLFEQFPEWQYLSTRLLGGMETALQAANDTRFHIEPSRSWCHRDLAPHNLLWDGQRVGMIDFDLAAVDDPLGDLLQICNHALYLGAVRNGPEWFEMVDRYAVSTAMSEREKKRVEVLLGFPETLVRAVTDWLRAGQPADDTFLRHAMECESKRRNWLQQFSSLV